MFLNLTSTPKIAQKGPKKAPKGPKKSKRGPKYGRIENKRQGCTFKTKVDCLYRIVRKKFLNLTPTPKIALKGKKRAKRPKLWPISNKDGALLPKLNLVVYIIRPKVQVQFDVLISSFNFKFQFQVSISSSISSFNFKIQFQVSISSFNFKFQFQVSNSSFNFKFQLQISTFYFKFQFQISISSSFFKF